MSNSGYYRQPTIFNDNIVFVSEDDLWSIPISGGLCQRLTNTNGLISRPAFSPDGLQLAFSSYEEGALDVYLMPSKGGEIKRLTYLGANSEVIGWENDNIIFSSAAKNAMRTPHLLKVNSKSGEVTNLNLGPGTSLSINHNGHVAIERNANRSDPAHWKRYRGGSAGQLWTAKSINEIYTRILSDINGNISSPQWIKQRLYFLSDHSGWGNIYSCLIDGTDLLQHTYHKDFYARNLKGDGKSFVYHAGADIYYFDPINNKSSKVNIEYHSQKPQKQRRFVEPTKNWETIQLSPNGDKLAFGARGKSYSFLNWQGPIFQHGEFATTRYRLPRWINNETLAQVSDFTGADQIELFRHNETSPHKTIAADFGNILEIKCSNNGKHLAISNHRNELLLVEIESSRIQTIMKNKFDFIRSDFNWSPDSNWLVFCQNLSKSKKVIQVYNLTTRETTAITRPGINYSNPVFDFDGEYLYFIGAELLNPVYSDVIFDMSFPRSHLPCVLPLRKETLSPFFRKFDDSSEPNSVGKNQNAKDTDQPKSTLIDFENIQSRMQSFPIAEGLYQNIIPAKDNKVYYSLVEIEGSLNQDYFSNSFQNNMKIKMYSYKSRKEEDYVSGITDFKLSADGNKQLIQIKNSVQITKSNDKPKVDQRDQEFNNYSGWVNFQRIKIFIDPAKEWRQMYAEAWKLQRDYFWTETMSKVDWNNVYKMYEPLVDRISSRSELSDLIWEMHGELATSHAYELGGDTKKYPNYPIGHLGADFKWNGQYYVIDKIYDGAISQADKMSPLLQPGVNAKVGDMLLAIDGKELSLINSPASALLHKADTEVEICIKNIAGATKSICVKTLSSDKPIRYRDWVEENRNYVHTKSTGKIGYVHIPDMGPNGYSEFFRTYLSEMEYDGLIVDARYNGGGHTSQLILDYLSRRRLGYNLSRWTDVNPYPDYSPAGPIVVLTNQYAGSDGDIFPHAFKLMKLGPVIGQRTWGGTIGIYPRYHLTDGGITTQPEFSFWFSDVGWSVENHGTVPDIIVDIAPHDFLNKHDPQLDRGIQETLDLLKKKPSVKPSLENL